ncbi:hypothetical protein ISCGN_013192 [Ixodes scapularis]
MKCSSSVGTTVDFWHLAEWAQESALVFRVTLWWVRWAVGVQREASERFRHLGVHVNRQRARLVVPSEAGRPGHWVSVVVEGAPGGGRPLVRSSGSPAVVVVRVVSSPGMVVASGSPVPGW